MPLFHIVDDQTTVRINPKRFQLERHLQRLVEANLPEIFGVRFISSEFVIRGEQPGRIDTLGLDYDGAPTIVEYKRAENDSVINQGLYYMHWLLDHRGDFVVAARDALGQDVEVNWNAPRLIIIAQGYANWDTHAVKLMDEAVELWKYTLYGPDLLYLELVYGQQRSAKPGPPDGDGDREEVYTLEDHLEGKSGPIKELFLALREGILEWSLEEGDILETPNKLYISYRHGKNFCEVEVQARRLKVYADISYDQLDDPQQIARDVSNIGHWGTGDVEIKIDNIDELEYALSLIHQAYRHTL
jgi:predicted transport protein